MDACLVLLGCTIVSEDLTLAAGIETRPTLATERREMEFNVTGFKLDVC